MTDKHSQQIDQAVAEIARYAYMNVEEAQDFICLYLERRVNSHDHKGFDDENMEGVFTKTAQELKIPIDALKTTIYDLLRKQNPHSK